MLNYREIIAIINYIINNLLIVFMNFNIFLYVSIYSF